MAKILCVEDEEDLRQDIVEELEDAGYDVSQAENGQKALEQILTDAPDLVVSDITMPIMDGYELVKRLRSEHSKYDEMPFIFLSALADRQNILEGMSSGCDDYLTKPIDFEMLLAKIETRLRQAQRMMHKKQNEQLLLYKAMQKKFGKPTSQETPAAETSPAPKANIAVVSSTSKLVSELVTMLKEQEYNVELFTSGRAYLRKVKNYKPDITCFGLKTDDYNISQIFKRCSKETGTRFLVVPSTGVKNLKFVLSSQEQNQLDEAIVMPAKREETIKKVDNALNKENQQSLAS